VGAALLSWALLSAAAGCVGQSGAGDLWGRPDRSGAHDAHATIATSGGGAHFRGDGTIVFKPRPAMSLRLQTQLGALPGQLDVLEVDGVTYQRPAGDRKWARGAIPVPDPSWSRASDPSLVAEETVAGTRAWHLRASRSGSPVELWVRVRDGYPLQLVTRNGSGMVFTFVFDRFNTGDRVLAPRGVELKPAPRVLSGSVGDVLALNAARIGALSLEDDATADDDAVTPRAGNRFIVVEVSVENTSAAPLSTYLDWRLTDGAGGTWAEALGVREPAFPAGELAPGEQAHGYLTYEVSATVSRLTLVVKLDDDRATFALA
jgi:Domain of unknown function (DUF4352)